MPPRVLQFRLDSNGKPKATMLRNVKALAPLLDRILVQRVKAEAKTTTGIYLPESTVEKLSEAKVLAVGPGGLDKDGRRVEVSVKPGDRVLIPPYGGSSVKVGDEEYTLFRDHEYASLLPPPLPPSLPIRS